MFVVEVVVRFGETILDIARITPGGSFRIGVEAGVDLAVDVGLRSFPLIGSRGDRFVVRRPAGLPAHVDGRSLADDVTELVPQPGEPITLVVGPVALEVTLVARAERVARGRFAVERSHYALVSLLAHLAFLGIADALASDEPPPAKVPVATIQVRAATPPPDAPVQIVRVARRAPAKQATAPRVAAVAPAPVETAAPAASEAPAARRRASAIEGARTGGILGAETRRTVQALADVTGVGTKLDDVGPVYREYEAQAKEFGGSGRGFRVDDDPRFASVKTGAYDTVAAGRATGEYFDLPGAVGTKQPPRVELAAEPGDARASLASRVAAMTACYERASRRELGNVTVLFEIDADGKVRHADGRGLGEIGACVAGIVAHTTFVEVRSTKARLSLAFHQP